MKFTGYVAFLIALNVTFAFSFMSIFTRVGCAFICLKERALIGYVHILWLQLVFLITIKNPFNQKIVSLAAILFLRSVAGSENYVTSLQDKFIHVTVVIQQNFLDCKKAFSAAIAADQ